MAGARALGEEGVRWAAAAARRRGKGGECGGTKMRGGGGDEGEIEGKERLAETFLRGGGGRWEGEGRRKMKQDES